MTITEELEILTKKTEERKEVVEQIKKIRKKEGEILYQIANEFVKEKITRGHSKKYSLAELLEKMPWEKSTLIKKLQKGTKEGILKHEKRKYSLNKENEIVKRMWNYYNEPAYQEKEKREEIRELTQRKRRVEEELEREEKERTRKYREIGEEGEEKIREEIKERLMEGVDTKEFIEKNILGIIGYRKQERRK